MSGCLASMLRASESITDFACSSIYVLSSKSDCTRLSASTSEPQAPRSRQHLLRVHGRHPPDPTKA